MKIEIGARVEITKMPLSSFYKSVKGIVLEVKNGFVTIEADEVISKWGDEYKEHPGTCVTAGRIENVRVL